MVIPCVRDNRAFCRNGADRLTHVAAALPAHSPRAAAAQIPAASLPPVTTTVIYKADTAIRLTNTAAYTVPEAFFASEPTLPVPCGVSERIRHGAKKNPLGASTHRTDIQRSNFVETVYTMRLRDVEEPHAYTITQLVFIVNALKELFCNFFGVVHTGFTSLRYNGIGGESAGRGTLPHLFLGLRFFRL